MKVNTQIKHMKYYKYLITKNITFFFTGSAKIKKM